MKTFKILLKEIKQENSWGYQDKDEVKLGEVMYDFKGKLDDEIIELKKGDKVLYQYGNTCKLDEEELVIISLNSLVCQK